MIMKNDYSKRSMPLNWGVSKSLTTSVGQVSRSTTYPLHTILLFGRLTPFLPTSNMKPRYP